MSLNEYFNNNVTYMEMIYLIAGVIIAIAIICIILISRGKIQKREADYRALFYLGLIFLPLGMSNPPFLICSFGFIALGLMNKEKWKPVPKWNDLTTTQKYLKIGVMVVLGFLVIAGFILWYLGAESTNQDSEVLNTNYVTNFEECIAAGNPAMESYPRQCRHGEETFVEEIVNKTDADFVSLVTQEEAILISGNTNDCTMAGIPASTAAYNTVSKTWWVDLERMPELENDGCDPACVVHEDQTAEVSWRCTGILFE